MDPELNSGSENRVGYEKETNDPEKLSISFEAAQTFLPIMLGQSECADASDLACRAQFGTHRCQKGVTGGMT